MERVIITGASKGFGNAVAMCYATAFKAPLHLVLHGRNEELLNRLKAEVLHIRQTAGRETSVQIVKCDLGDSNELAGAVDNLFMKTKQDQCEYARTTFINNAGSLGKLTCIGQNNLSAAEINQYYQLNMTSACFLTNAFVQMFRDGALSSKEIRVVNVSSLAAVESFPSWGFYCSAKAGREMFHKTLAQEYTDDRSVMVLNYAPGPLDTDMQAEVRSCDTIDPKIHEFYVTMFQDGKLVDPIDSAKKLLRLLVSEKYSSGQHVDWFDVIPGVDAGTPGVKNCCACLFCTCEPCECKSMGKPQCDACVVDITLQKCKVARTDK